MKLSIRYKLLSGFTLVLILSYLIQTLSFRITEQYIRSQTSNIQLEKAQNAADSIQNFIAEIELDHLGIAREYQKNLTADHPHVINIINHALWQNRFFNKVTLLSPTGRELIKIDRFGQTPKGDLSYEIPTEPLNKAISGQTGISKVYFSQPESIPQVDVFSPIVSDTGTVIGVVKGQLQLDRLWDLIAQVKLGRSGFAYVVDEEGRLIAHPNLDLVLEGPNLSSRKLIASLLDETPKQRSKADLFYTNETGILVASNGLSIPGTGWVVVVEQPVSEAFAQLTLIRNLFFTTLIGSLALLIVISLILSENLSNPIRKLQHGTELLKKGKLETHVDIRSGDEIEELANSFNLMAAKLKGSIDELEEKITQLEEQKGRLDQSAQLLLRRDLDLRSVNEELEENLRQLKEQKKRLDLTAKLLLRRDINIREMNEELDRDREEIMAERNKLEVIISGITDAVIAVDLKRNIIIFNKAAEDLTGFSSNVVLGKPIDKVIQIFDKDNALKPPDYCPVETTKPEGVVLRREGLKVVGFDNKETYINLVAGHIEEGPNINLGCILTFHDISKEQELEEMKLDFVSMAAHELRTPLTAIRGYLEVFIEENKEQLNEEQNTFLNRMNIASKQLASLVDNLLNVSRIEKGALTLSLESVNWADLVKRTCTEFVDRAKDRKIKLTFNEKKHARKFPKVKVDKLRVTEVLSNLLSNAISYTQPRGKVKVSIQLKKNEIVTHIQDTGVGIPKSALPHLFTKFFRVSGKLEQGSKGTGLGLYISKAIVDMHYGKIWARSILGKGSTFSFSLPIKQPRRHEKKIINY